MSDHVENTRKALHVAGELMGDEEFAHADNAVKAAQVHATLALAAEQRTANLIAFSAACYGNCDDGGAFRQAAERLGLAND